MRPLFPYLILLLFLLVFPVPVKAQPYELAYDDGTAEFGFVCTVGCIAAVKFSVNSSVQILKLRYFIWGETLPFRVHVLDSNFSSIFSQDVQPSSADPHWFEVDISGENVIVNGDFFVGLEWRKLYDEWPRPWLGADKTSPCKRSYLGSLFSPPVSPKEGENYLIRVVVQKAPDPPSLTIFEPQISDLIVTINGVTLPGHKGASITRIHWDWGDGSSEDSWFPASHRYNKPGKYTVTVTSYQSDGLSTTKTIKVQINEPPTAYIDSISPNPAYEGQTISFSGHGYDPDGNITECDWRADGRVLSSSCSFSTSLPPGKYTIYFRVKDDKGIWSSWVYADLVVKKAENKPPVASLVAYPLQANAGDEVKLDASGSYDSDGKIVAYYFDFGDGRTSGWVLNSSITYIYSHEGEYKVRVIVKDDKGATGETTSTIVVKPPLQPSSQPPPQSLPSQPSSQWIALPILAIFISIILIFSIIKLRSKTARAEEILRRLLEE
jgi:PKD repeat protein